MDRANTISSLTEEVTKLNQEWIESYARRDTAFLQRYLADDYVGTFPDGTVFDKKGEIESIASGAITLLEMKPSRMNVRLYGDAAVITGQSTIRAKVQGREESGEFRFTDVWVKQSGGWKAVASQATRIANP